METLLYWLNEYLYSLEEHGDGKLWLMDHQEKENSRPITILEVIDMFVSQLEDKQSYEEEPTFVEDIDKLKELKSNLESVKDITKLTSFIYDHDKMIDYTNLTKEEFLDSYSYLTEYEYDLTNLIVETAMYADDIYR